MQFYCIINNIRSVIIIKINIEIETNFNIGDMVYTISKQAINNDWFCDEFKWMVDTYEDYGKNKYKACPIETRQIKQMGKHTEILYLINNYLYSENDIFTKFENAKLECEKRNKQEY